METLIRHISLDPRHDNVKRVQAAAGNIAAQVAAANIGRAPGTEFAARFTLLDLNEQGNLGNINPVLEQMNCVASTNEKIGKKATYVIKDPRFDTTEIFSKIINGSILRYRPICQGCTFLTKRCVIVEDFTRMM